MIIVSIIAPHMTGILVKIFTWFLESPIFGPLLLYILKGNNLINKVSSWSMLSSFHFREILFQLNRISSCVLLVTLLLLNDWRNQQCGYHLNSNFLFPIHGQFLFLQLITNADLEENYLLSSFDGNSSYNTFILFISWTKMLFPASSYFS